MADAKVIQDQHVTAAHPVDALPDASQAKPVQGSEPASGFDTTSHEPAPSQNGSSELASSTQDPPPAAGAVEVESEPAAPSENAEAALPGTTAAATTLDDTVQATDETSNVNFELEEATVATPGAELEPHNPLTALPASTIETSGPSSAIEPTDLQEQQQQIVSAEDSTGTQASLPPGFLQSATHVLPDSSDLQPDSAVLPDEATEDTPDPFGAEQDNIFVEETYDSSDSVAGSHLSDLDAAENSSQPYPRVDLLQDVAMPATLAPYLEPLDEGTLPTEDNNDLENIRAPPVLLSHAGQTFWLFAQLQESGTLPDPTSSAEKGESAAASAAGTSTAVGEDQQALEQPEREVLFPANHELYYAPLTKLFDHLHDLFPSFLADGMEIRLNVQELGIEIAEDNSYAGDLTLHDLDRLHIGCDLTGRLHVTLTESIRAILRFNTLAHHVASFTSARPEVPNETTEPSVDPLLDDNDLTEAVVMDEQAMTGEAIEPEDQDDIAAELQGDELLEDAYADAEDDSGVAAEISAIGPEEGTGAIESEPLVSEEGQPGSALDAAFAPEEDPTQDNTTVEVQEGNGFGPDSLAAENNVLTHDNPEASATQPEDAGADSSAADASHLAAEGATDGDADAQHKPPQASDDKRNGISPKRVREEDEEAEGALTPTEPHDAKRMKSD